MRMREAKKLKNGIYWLTWKLEGGGSRAAVGRDVKGNVWFAPTNWVAGLPSYKWRLVRGAFLILADS